LFVWQEWHDAVYLLICLDIPGQKYLSRIRRYNLLQPEWPPERES
jgi:hypothetical protein